MKIFVALICGKKNVYCLNVFSKKNIKRFQTIFYLNITKAFVKVALLF